MEWIGERRGGSANGHDGYGQNNHRELRGRADECAHREQYLNAVQRIGRRSMSYGFVYYACNHCMDDRYKL